MLYNLNDDFQRKQAETYFAKLLRDGDFIELTKKKRQRSLPQNAYLHLILGYFAAEVGVTLDYAKRAYFKSACNADLFMEKSRDELLGRDVTRLRSSRDLTTEQMTTAIERFRSWAAENGIYIPAPNETEYLNVVEAELERKKRYL